jgi:hypothetical protein
LWSEDLGSHIYASHVASLGKTKKKKKKKKVKEEEELCIYLMFSAFSDSNGQKKKRAL